MKPLTFASVLTFVALMLVVEEANAYYYCELKGGSSKKEWACKECSPNAICGVKEDCQTKCAKAETPKQAESCLTLNCPPPEVRSKREIERLRR
jgi:hypothetical protein